MGEVGDRLQSDIQAAMKSGDKTRLQTMRMLATSVRNREIEVGHDLSEEEFVEVAGREVKRRREAAEAYDDAGRAEKAEQERAEQGILQAFMPEQLSEDQVAAIVDEAITATGASGPKEVGKVMGHVMSRHRGRVDGSTVSRLARERLSADEV